MNLTAARSQKSHGFTLLETMVAIVIMGIVAGFTIPGLYGIYQRQQMLNTANEVIAAIKVARAKALANDQGIYIRTPPITEADCDSTISYVDYYTVSINADNKGYSVAPALKGSCKVTPTPVAVLNRSIPNPITVSNSVNFPIYYKTTSGKVSYGSINATNSSASVELLANGFLGDVKYYVCISQEKMYAQTTACS